MVILPQSVPTFKERFKGKTSRIGKEGVDAMIVKSSKPIDKIMTSDQSYLQK